MAKDYAKRVFITTRSPKKKRRRWVNIVAPILLVSAIVAYWGYSHKTYPPLAENTFVARTKAFLTHKPYVANKSPATTTKVAESTNHESEIHFDFYNELPKMQVTVPEKADDVAASPIIKKTHASADNTYVLQLGVYKEATLASQERLSLLLSDCEAQVAKIETEDGEEAYRVQQGPLNNLAEAKKIQHELQAKGIVSVIKKIG